MDYIPESPQGAAGPGADKAQRETVSIPAYLLMATGVLVALFWLINLVLSVSGSGEVSQIPPELYDNPNFEQYRALIEMIQRAQAEGPGVGEILFSLLGVGLGGLIFFGGLQMTKLRMYGLGITASILAMIPCFSCCCCVIGLPVGIWSLVVLSRPEVRAAFR